MKYQKSLSYNSVNINSSLLLFGFAFSSFLGIGFLLFYPHFPLQRFCDSFNLLMKSLD